jgi:hypothetical protein
MLRTAADKRSSSLNTFSRCDSLKQCGSNIKVNHQQQLKTTEFGSASARRAVKNVRVHGSSWRMRG